MMENLVDLQQMAQVKRQQEIDLPPNGNAHDLLVAVYRNPALDLSVRMRAAMACLQFEVPKLGVSVVVNEHDFAVLLDKRLENLRRLEQNQANGQVIEAASSQVEVKPPMPRLSDRRYRRM